MESDGFEPFRGGFEYPEAEGVLHYLDRDQFLLGCN